LSFPRLLLPLNAQKVEGTSFGRKTFIIMENPWA